jgi:outer membrane lipoprotein-sorting protein
MIRPLAAAGLFVLAPLAVVPGADPLAAVLARMDQAARPFRCVTANIQETVYTQVVDDKAISGGTIKLRRARPGDIRFLVDFTNPDAPRSVAFAGTEIRIYKPKENVEQVIDVATHKAAIEEYMLLGFGATAAEIAAAYNVSYVGPAVVEGQHAAELKLTPKSKEVQARLTQAELWISDTLGVPVQQKFLYPGGNYTLFTYTNLKLMPALPDKDLQLKTPKDVHVTRVGA